MEPNKCEWNNCLNITNIQEIFLDFFDFALQEWPEHNLINGRLISEAWYNG